MTEGVSRIVNKMTAFDAKADVALVEKAYVFAEKAHETQLRASGEPYITHPLEVAEILADMHLDATTIITALLHDTVEDTSVTLHDVKVEFGGEIANLVDGVTKLTQIESQSASLRRAENFRKLVLAMSKDIRVLLVKLADRLHNMRTLEHTNPEKRQQKSLETLEFYVPLADRMGMHGLKNELEDLCFSEIYPEARMSIIKRLEQMRETGEILTGEIIEELTRALKDAGFSVKVSGREKSPYSIWHKMQKKNLNFEQLSDIMAFRVVVDDKDTCYRILGIIHGKYPVFPGRFKDYISTPKPNNYQSLHTVVLGPKQRRIEVQIRTQEMHDIAEWGIAAHWNYKAPEEKGQKKQEGPQYRWLRNLVHMLEQSSNPEEFLENSKLEMFQDQVFCFTPKGDLVALPKGATTVDFAYEVHTEVGNHCVGAKVNGRLLPLRTVLQNGDQVEIVTSPNQTPSPSWEQFVTTGKAKSCIKKFMRSEKRVQFIELGKSILKRHFQEQGHDIKEQALEDTLWEQRLQSLDDLYASVGEGHLTAQEVFSAVLPTVEKEEEKAEKNKKILEDHYASSAQEPKPLSIEGLTPGVAIHLGNCCHPLPGDRIVGIVSAGHGVMVHTIDCESLERYVEEPDRWLDLAWSHKIDDEEQGMHIARIQVLLAHEPGSLAILSSLIGKNHANINNLKVANRTQEYFEILVDIEVRDVQHLSHIIAILRASSSIYNVERLRGT